MHFDYTVDSEIGFDRLVVAYSTDGIRFQGTEYEGVQSGHGFIDLPRREDQVWVGFHFASDHGIGRPIGAAVDNVVIRRHDPISLGAPENLAYGWLISDSDTAPVAGFAGNADTYYLWYVCDDDQYGGATRLEGRFELSQAEWGDFVPLNGVVQDDHLDPRRVLITLPGCTTAPFLAGSIHIDPRVGYAPAVCLEPVPSVYSEVVTFDCTDEPRPSRVVGWSSVCLPDSMCGVEYRPPFSVDRFTWGRIKALHR